jgi:hypothetical protein
MLITFYMAPPGLLWCLFCSFRACLSYLAMACNQQRQHKCPIHKLSLSSYFTQARAYPHTNTSGYFGWGFSRVCSMSIMVIGGLSTTPNQLVLHFFLLRTPRRGSHTYEILYSPVHCPPPRSGFGPRLYSGLITCQEFSVSCAAPEDAAPNPLDFVLRWYAFDQSRFRLQ